MRIFMKTTERAKLVSKALRKAFAARGREARLAQCQEIVAEMFGYKSWHELTKLHASHPPSLDDAEAPSSRGYRRHHYITVLLRHDVSADDAAAILDEVKPTDRTVALLTDRLPRLLVEAFETDADGKRLRSLGVQDLTADVVHTMMP